MLRRAAITPRTGRESEQEHHAVAVERRQETEQEPGDEAGAADPQRAAVAQEPERGEQQDLHRDLRGAVARERDLRHRERQRRGRGQRGERVPEEPRREEVEHQQREPPRIGTIKNMRRSPPTSCASARIADSMCDTPNSRCEPRGFIPVDDREEGTVFVNGATNGSDVERAVRRDPLAGVEVLHAVTLDLHVLRRVETVPVMLASEIAIAPSAPALDASVGLPSARARAAENRQRRRIRPAPKTSHRTRLELAEIGEHEADRTERREGEHRTEHDDTHPERLVQLAHSRSLRFTVRACRTIPRDLLDRSC